jgi:hypothetical protein
VQHAPWREFGGMQVAGKETTFATRLISFGMIIQLPSVFFFF